MDEVTAKSTKTPAVKELKPLENIKLLFSSLFGRQMNSIIIGAEKEDNVIYFSNIGLDEIDIYEQDSSKYIHRVTIFNNKILEDLYTLCPLCKDHILYIDGRQFLSALTKEAKSKYTFEITQTNMLVLATDKASYPVGMMISAYTASLYVDIFKIGLVDNEDMFEKTIEPGTISATEISMWEVYNNSMKEKMTRVALCPSKNLVSLKEYPVKAKLEGYILVLRVYGDKACNIECDFHTNDIKVQSVQPGIRYYCRACK